MTADSLHFEHPLEQDDIGDAVTAALIDAHGHTQNTRERGLEVACNYGLRLLKSLGYKQTAEAMNTIIHRDWK